MPRYKLLIEYHGGAFQGWQRLPGIPTLQHALEDAASKLDEAPVEVIGAGRTDSGVHATGQVAHLDLVTARPHKVADAMNFHLRPHAIAVLSAEECAADFHARFSARTRHYRYIISNRRAHMALQQGLAWRVPVRLDEGAMHTAAQSLIGKHDFSTFRDAACQATSPIRTLDSLAVTRIGAHVHITCSAQSFLHRQVRSLVGSLVDIGRGHRPVSWAQEILKAADRTRCGPIAPPDGLYLERVEY